MNSRFSRQSFLGPSSEGQLGNAVIAIVGLGGGGSHIVQQCAHLGFRNFVLYDGDRVEDTNLNRLVGATTADVAAQRPKVEVAARLIRSLDREATIEPIQDRWQTRPEALRRCDLVFGAVDSSPHAPSSKSPAVDTWSHLSISALTSARSAPPRRS